MDQTIIVKEEGQLYTIDTKGNKITDHTSHSYEALGVQHIEECIAAFTNTIISGERNVMMCFAKMLYPIFIPNIICNGIKRPIGGCLAKFA